MDLFNKATDAYFNRPKDDDSDSDESDIRTAAKYAAVNTDNDKDDKAFFKNILGELGQKKEHLAEEDIDEEDAITSHRSIFSSSSSAQPATEPTKTPDSSTLGNAAALQALKVFLSSSNTPSPQATNESQNAFVGLAMAQAAKLFDQQAASGNVASESSKNAAVLKAGELALKMYLKSNKGSAGPAGSGLGGLGGLGAGLVGAYLSGSGDEKKDSGASGLLGNVGKLF